MVYTLWNLVSELPVIWYWHFNIWNTWYVRCGTHVIIKTTTTVCLIFLMYAFLVCAWKRTSGIFKRPANTLVHKWCSSSEAVCTETSLRTVPVQEEASLFVNQIPLSGRSRSPFHSGGWAAVAPSSSRPATATCLNLVFGSRQTCSQNGVFSLQHLQIRFLCLAKCSWFSLYLLLGAGF